MKSKGFCLCARLAGGGASSASEESAGTPADPSKSSAAARKDAESARRPSAVSSRPNTSSNARFLSAEMVIASPAIGRVHLVRSPLPQPLDARRRNDASSASRNELIVASSLSC